MHASIYISEDWMIFFKQSSINFKSAWTKCMNTCTFVYHVKYIPALYNQKKNYD